MMNNPRPRRSLQAVLLLLSIVLVGNPAVAQLSDEEVRAAARSLADDGEAFSAAGNHAAAIEKFARAYELVNAPTIALRHAECLEKVGRLVEARGKYLQISRLRLADDAPDVFRQAIAVAERAVAALEGRISHIEVTVLGTGLEDATLTVDGRVIPSVVWGVKLPIDPGKHLIKLEKGGRKVSKEVVLAERESVMTTLVLPDSSTVAKPARKGVPAPKATARPTPAATASETPTPTSTLGWISIGVGGAGMLVGAMTGVVALGQRTTLINSCPDLHCPAALQGDVDSYDRNRTISAIGFAVGLVGTGAGIGLLLSSGESNPSRAGVGASGYVGLGTVGLRGSF